MKGTTGSSGKRQLPFELAEIQLVGLTRLALSVWALLAVYIDPIEADGFFFFTYFLIGSYALYSVIICLLHYFRAKIVPFRALHWIDTFWYLLLIAFSAGTSSIFYFFFFFSILAASFRYGFSEGFKVTAMSAFSFTVVGYLTAPAGDVFELNRFILRPGYLVILGYLMAYWGEKEIASKKQLRFLRDLSRLSNPRFGIDHTVSSMLKQILDFYDAEVCLVVVRGLNAAPFSIIKIARGEEENAALTPVAKQAIAPLLTIPSRIAFAFNAEQNVWNKVFARKKYFAIDLKRERGDDGHQKIAEGIANFLEVKSLVSLPIVSNETKVGRLFVGADRYRFRKPDLELMLQAGEQIIPVVENVRLLDDLASKSAERERMKISRDLHDSTVQPYLGLKFKLESILRKLSPHERLYREIDELIEMITKSVTDLRGYISHMKDETASREPVLIDAIRRQVAQFTKYHAIEVDLDAPKRLQIPDRLAAEVFQMVSEGLSNINRHSKSDQAAVRILVRNKSLILLIENNHPENGSEPPNFFPKSLAGRAKALGGDLTVEQNGKTSVVIKVPI